MAVKENPYFETKLEPHQDVANKILSHLWPFYAQADCAIGNPGPALKKDFSKSIRQISNLFLRPVLLTFAKGQFLRSS